MRSIYDPAQRRALLSLSFEPAGNGYLFYRNRWSRGIPVSADEREAYLALPLIGPSKSAWLRKIADRQPIAPPRTYAPVKWKLLGALPLSTGMVSAMMAVVGATAAWGAASLFARLAYGTGGCVFLMLAVQIFWARLRGRDG